MTTLIPKYDQGATGAVNRAINLKLAEQVSVKDFGAIGDGTTDDTAAFNAALTASNSVFVPATTNGYKLTSTITIPANTRLWGTNQKTTKLLHSFNGDMFYMSANTGLVGLYLEGQGGTYTGKGLTFNGTDSGQYVQNCKIINFSSACLYFSYQAGSTSSFINLETYQISGATGSGNYAIVIDPTSILTAVPRKFTQIETGGSCSFDFGGCADVFISNSFLSDLNYTANTRGVLISTSRIANQSALTINGHNNTIIGCDINPSLTIASSADNIALQGNSYNNLPIVDNSGNNRNLIDSWVTSYSPALTSGGTAPSLGNGTLTGYFYNTGASTTIVGELTLGTTTSLGTGGLSISLPQARGATGTFAGGTIYMNRGGTIYSGFLSLGSGATTAQLFRDTTGSITFNSPGTFASGDFIRWSITYSN